MMILSLALAAQVASGRLPPAQPILAPDFETANVLVPIQKLFAAFEMGDSTGMLRLVFADGRVTATGERASGSGLRQQSWSEFAQRVKPDSRFSETISDPAIEIDGDAAMVWAPFVVRVDGKVSNCGFDHFDLVRDNGTWKIMNLTFSSRLTGCPQ
ncbi:nuclear transport factor 2 family protein [Sphingomonas sp.]|uniref:nuclear transport factor 2 family protein n=1 Tax=Sphingomonas sp. TaxID=28214 RepID=UPI00286BCFC3|nr:nuclear transport factor 2 family protein [Sphingomonas sp.]